MCTHQEPPQKSKKLPERIASAVFTPDAGDCCDAWTVFSPTTASTTDGDSRLFRKGKGKESKLCHMGHILTENRNGFIVEAEVTEAGTSQEWDAGTTMLAKQRARPGRTVGADKGYDTLEFVEGNRGPKHFRASSWRITSAPRYAQ